MYPPPEALRTSCVPGCSGTVEWVYEPGEPASYWHPGEPDIYTPEGCRMAHLEDLSSLGRYPDIEERVVYLHDQWDALYIAAWIMAYWSRQALIGKPIDPIIPVDKEDWR